jgi:hypothetical protein
MIKTKGKRDFIGKVYGNFKVLSRTSKKFKGSTTYLYEVQCIDCGSIYQREINRVKRRKLNRCICTTPAGYAHRLKPILAKAKPCKYCGETFKYYPERLPAPLKLKGGLCKECRNFLNDEERRDIPKFESHHRRYKLMWQQYLAAKPKPTDLSTTFWKAVPTQPFHKL